MRHFVFIILLGCAIQSINAQYADADSLENQLKAHTSYDTARVDLLNELALMYRKDIKRKKSYETYINEADSLSNVLGYRLGRIDNLIIKGTHNSGLFDFSSARNYYQKALQIAEEVNDSIRIGRCYNLIGLSYRHQGNFEKALEYYQKAQQLNVMGVNAKIEKLKQEIQ